MITVHHALGHEAYKVATTSELIETLQKYPPDMPVYVECEGVWTSIDISPRFISVDELDGGAFGMKEGGLKILVFDTDFNR